MKRGPANPNRLLGVLRYGASSSTGPDPSAEWLEMSPGELAGASCREIFEADEAILAAASSFTPAQRSALLARVEECADAGVLGVGLIPALTRVQEEAPGGIVGAAARGALGAEGALGGLADVVGNALLALAGLGLVVLGVTRVFGVNVGPLRAARGR